MKEYCKACGADVTGVNDWYSGLYHWCPNRHNLITFSCLNWKGVWYRITRLVKEIIK